MSGLSTSSNKDIKGNLSIISLMKSESSSRCMQYKELANCFAVIGEVGGELDYTFSDYELLSPYKPA